MTTKRFAMALALVAAMVATIAYAQPPSEARTLDRFDDVTAWKAVASDGVTASIARVVDGKRAAMRLDFDLGGTAGYALARRALPLDLPENYAITFWLRADAPVNDLQVKFVDESGDDVWWYRQPNFTFPSEWQPITIRKRQIDFAWGPTKDRTLRHVAAIEIAVAAGSGGGHGALYVSDLALQERPPESAPYPPPKVRTSSADRGAAGDRVLDGNVKTAWRSKPGRTREQWLEIDFGRPREFGGLVLDWSKNAYASRYDVQFSDDGRKWRTVRHVVEGGGGRAALLLSESETRYLRLLLYEGPLREYALNELVVEDIAFGASPNAFFMALAHDAPRGYFPRGFVNEQGAWTLVGVDGGHDSGLLSEDGALEIGQSGFTIEPFVVERGKVATWADVASRPFLVDDDLPMPGVEWTAAHWTLRVTTFATGAADDVHLVARYDLTNTTDQPLPLTLALAARPFQVNPPAQFLNTAGGASPIHDLAWDGGSLTVNGVRNVYPLAAPARVGLRAFDAGPLVPSLAAPLPRARKNVHDEFGYASGALFFPGTLSAHQTVTFGIVVPLTDHGAAPALGDRTPAQWLTREQLRTVAVWRAKLDRVTIRVPEEAQPLADALHTALANILVSRDGPVLRPGTRAYARSWIRDGTLIAEALLRLGHPSIAADYLRWYAPYQFANGKIPCCVDARGADPVPENDSAGEFIFLVAEVYRYTHDRALLEAMWPHVEKAAAYMGTLRHAERQPGAGRAARPATNGMMPASISHEGYSEKPVHSYWDDFWALKGYASAVTIAEALGRAGDARALSEAHDEFAADLLASLRATAAAHGIDYLPGSVELGDFDPTSSTIALAPLGDERVLPPSLVAPTFERYWREFVARRDGTVQWKDYTPYELRNVGAFVRLGWRERAHALLDFFLTGRRPAAWNQWPEVVGHDPRAVTFVGDLPHAWVASDFIRSVLDLFAYARADGAMVLARGIPAAWLDRAGVSIRGLRTPYGTLSYSLARISDRIAELTLTASGSVPPGGFVLAGPWARPLHATISGKPVAVQGDEVRIDELQARVVLELPGSANRVAK
ncbi:MAG TPA: discoidin domain-containing protein [Casimicrobiaceae bacterium]|nr:discoidin domain-containing protein [Casimicrobiaceae bacterium]